MITGTYGTLENNDFQGDGDTELKASATRKVKIQSQRTSSISRDGVPLTIATRRRSTATWQSLRERDLASIADSVFSDIRSVSIASEADLHNEAELYGICNALQRAFPERSFALIVTMLFELPTLFLISGGSDRLCTLIGRWRYTTLVSLLPIISAISGNVGLQASTLTTRAISHGQVHVENYSEWLAKEVRAALYLGKIHTIPIVRPDTITQTNLFPGVAIGSVTAMISLFMGGFSIPFAVSVFCAQFIGQYFKMKYLLFSL